jgi:plasmid stabilization system protein ParE
LVHGEARRAVLRRFPYSVIYAVREDEIVVIACFHGRRDPKRWQDRL